MTGLGSLPGQTEWIAGCRTEGCPRGTNETPHFAETMWTCCCEAEGLRYTVVLHAVVLDGPGCKAESLCQRCRRTHYRWLEGVVEPGGDMSAGRGEDVPFFLSRLFAVKVVVVS